MHTEAPWTINGREIHGAPDTGTIVARIPEWGILADSPDPGPDNARLIAAAPDLLAALRDLLDASVPTYDNRHELDAARDAIARTLESRQTEDGYRLFRLPSGEWVDHLDPARRDLTFAQFPDDALDALRAEYEAWGAANGFGDARPLLSADETLIEYDLTRDQRAFLVDFIVRWEATERGEA